MLPKAPLKPQRIFALKAGALPKVYYPMALGRINISDIRKADKMLRAVVRQWMALSNDISIGYFHDSLPSMASPAPSQGPPSRTSRKVVENGSTYNTHEEIKKRWAAILHQSIDGL